MIAPMMRSAAAPMTPMEDERFWTIIARAGEVDDDPDRHIKALHGELMNPPLDDVAGFEIAFRKKLNDAYSWDLWGAAYVIHGGCSDDGFEYFRRWLVVKGREVYETAVADPDSLAERDLAPGDDEVWEFERIYYVALDVWQEKGGSGDVREHSEAEAGLSQPGPAGEPFDEDEEALASRYPKLWARFGENPLG